MLKICLVIIVCLSTFNVFAQKDTADNYVNRFITIPSIKVNLVPDSLLFTNENIKKNEKCVQ